MMLGRRRFAALVTTLAAGAPGWLAAQPVHAHDRAMAAMGRACLRLHRQSVLQDCQRIAQAALSRSDLLWRVRQDFHDGHTLLVDGWVISRTEAALCALVALDDPRPA